MESLPSQRVPTFAPPSTDTNFSLGDAWAAVRKHKVLVLVAVSLGIALALTVSASMTRIFEASTTVYFDPRPPQPLGEQVEPVVNTSADYWNRKEYYNTQHWILTSRATLEPVVLQMRLHFDRGFLENKPGRTFEKSPVVASHVAAAILSSRMKVTPVNDSRLAKVTYRDANRERSAEILNAITRVYIGQNEQEIHSATTEASTWLHGQVETLKGELEASEVALHDYKKDRNLLSLSLDDQSNMLRVELEQLNGALTQAKTRRQQIASRATALGQVSETDPSQLPARELLESSVLQGLRTEYMNAAKEVDGLRAGGKGSAHPEMATAVARHDIARKALLDEVKNNKVALSRDVQAIDSEIGGLQRLYNDASTKALEVNKLEIDYKRLRRSRDTNERLFSMVTERSKESDLARLLRLNNVKVIESALAPPGPVSPNVPLNLVGGCVAGLIFGLAGAIAREAMDRTIRSPEDAEVSVGLPLLGMLPASAGASLAYGKRRKGNQERENQALDQLAHTSPTSSFAEAARAVRTSVMFSAADRKLRSILVTSAVAGDGKTTVACNLAITIAQAGQSVVLVDCDLRRSRIHHAFQIDSRPGLTGVLVGSGEPKDAVVSSVVPNLNILAAGALPPNPSELLHSVAFGDLLERLKEQYDVVVIDSPPLVPVTDAAVIATRVDAVVLVARAQKTSRNAARRAIRILQDVGARPVGLVLNAFDIGSGRQGYYYREYGYHQLAERGNDAKSAS